MKLNLFINKKNVRKVWYLKKYSYISNMNNDKNRKMQDLIKSLRSEFKTYLNTEALINKGTEEYMNALYLNDIENSERKEKYVNLLIEKQENQLKIVCDSYGIKKIDFIGLLEEYEFKNK